MAYGNPWRLVVCAAVALGLSGCATGPAPPRCKVEVVRLDQYGRTPRGDVLAAWQVRGDAGAPARLWLAGKTADGSWISGPGFDEIGPGPFNAVVELELAAPVREYKVVLEVAGRRCGADAQPPR